MDKMKIVFPHNEEVEFEYGEPVVLLGANGAGKTRFSVKIEELNDPAYNGSNQLEKSLIHRLSAQKSLTISNSIPIYDYDSSKRNLFIGNSNHYANKSNSRFQNNPATVLLTDYQYVLSLLFSEAQRELQCEHNEALECCKKGKPIPKPPETVVDKAQRIWNSLLPRRTIDLSGNGVHANFNGQKYHGQEMSDGERVMLYMIAQALVVKPNTLFIIDEPELHIHKGIVKELWTLLENERPDCVFMYLTHDIDFALSRNNAQYLWIKNYDGNDWEYEPLNVDDYPDLPTELLLEISGTRQKIVFVEGTKDSYDYKLYQEIYREKGYHVIPCGGCEEVIRLVKAKETYKKLILEDVCGIVDRDFRVDREIDALKSDGVFTLEVAEVENLFVVPELLEIMEKQLGCDSGAAQAAKDFIIELFHAKRDEQIAKAVSKEISYQLSLFNMGNESFTDKEIKAKIDEKYSVENIRRWQQEKEQLFNISDNLTEILKVFNYKDLSKKVGPKSGLSDKNFPKRVINVLSKDKEARKTILQALSNYIPKLP